MFRPRLRGRRFWIATLGVPGLIWVLIVLLTPTGWVKTRLITHLEAATGRSVRIGSVQLGLCGDLAIVDLSLAERSSPDKPWLKAQLTALNVHPVRLLLGCCQPSVVVIDHADVRIWRRSDGSFEFGDLTRCARSNGVGSSESTLTRPWTPAINLRVKNSTIRLQDDHNAIGLNLKEVAAHGSFQSEAVQLDHLEGQINGGTFELAARLVRDAAAPHFQAELQARKVRLDAGLNLIETYVPLIARADDTLGGRLNIRLALKGQGSTSAQLRRTLNGHGSILLDPFDLDGSRILDELRVLGDWPAGNQVGAVSSNFVVEQGRVTTDDLTIRATKLPFVVAGWTDFDGRFDYETRVDRMVAGLPREARSLLGDLQLNLNELAGLRIFGDKGESHLTLNGRPLALGLDQSNSERVRFRQTARQLRDRFFR